jgi:hypothetical protein
VACLLMAAWQSLSFAQSSATVSGDHAEATAGQPFTLHLTFDTAATCEHRVQLALGNQSKMESFVLQGTLGVGQSVTDVSIDRISNDYSGEFVSNMTMFGKPQLLPCRG